MNSILAIIIATVAAFIAGSIWYSVLFGKAYRKAMGVSEKDMKKGMKDMPKLFGLLIVCELVMASVLAHIIGYRGAPTAVYGLVVGTLLWFGFVLPTIATNYAFGKRPMALFLIDAFHHLLVLVIMGAIIGALL